MFIRDRPGLTIVTPGHGGFLAKDAVRVTLAGLPYKVIGHTFHACDHGHNPAYQSIMTTGIPDEASMNSVALPRISRRRRL